mmetsp:Transcript_1652/g.3096  ORF Transcript_1652/g.3096 Transcript_1652/m.3096 type:complete len:136 (-) Transcript_1652:1111-1518(-)
MPMDHISTCFAPIQHLFIHNNIKIVSRYTVSGTGQENPFSSLHNSTSKPSVYSIRNRSRQTTLVPWQLHSFQRFQIIKPNRLWIILGKEWTANPALISTLEETKNECFLSHDLLHTSNLHLARRTTHGRSACSTD